LQKNLSKAVEDIAKYKSSMQQQLLEFSQTDMLFFFSEKEELYKLQKQYWMPIIEWAEKLLGMQLTISNSLSVPSNEGLKEALKKQIKLLNDKKFCCWYAAALNMRSVLLGLALIKNKCSAKDAAYLSALEELWQNEQWGEDEESKEARTIKEKELFEIEAFNQ
jgi:chaperone required for assembly of F1-ATPase